MTDCTLCDEVQKKLENIPEGYRKFIISNDNLLRDLCDFLLLPSFGPLNRTHSMIVPRLHVNNFSALDYESRVKVSDFIEELRVRFKGTFDSDLVFFESGAGSVSSHSGGCVTHAHIHCVESNAEFERRLFEEVGLEKLPVLEEGALDAQLGYIWYKGGGGQEYYKNNPLLPSQFLRYLYMENSRTPQKWNWRRDIDLNGIQGVIDTYGRVFS